ncbi:biotin--[acetyl-CoA-carboxylase] ligase [Prosthecomicrobium pneumaticum]|uniref:biotin--[biotin carboxyl-carrier protein] ligase n=1 Tax=Prosthecomicrobium pneumaticum TaxID=81895 RepID=A0A7W9CSR9_9HYPH|nr:biotin--[acetyl-CoA-carboxylase] ligase [Prosthecomicrobium pneumaticum]MBB5751245.1 BirA family biotin operon repressor/biotin-[acetyl-CoA-carboxylase] ligase [Prosthecomicrobium pneumaticum]
MADFALGPAATAAGYRLIAYPTVGSTNAEALQRAREGDPGRLWLASDHQTGGRGRRGSSWQTPRGNLAASVLTVLPAQSPRAATLGFVAGLALDEALRKAAPQIGFVTALDGAGGWGGAVSDRVRLKWPNDVLIDKAKLAGILLEAEPLPDGRFAVVVGIGVNVQHAPTGLPYPATALAAEGATVDAASLFIALTESWAGIERVWDGGRGFPALRRLWLERAAGLGEAVAVRIGEEVFRGVFETIDEEGHLVIRSGEGKMRTIAAGEVHFGTVATAR